MIAYRLLNAQTKPEFQEVPEPHAGPGQVVVKVAGSGLCHTDFRVIGREQSYWKDNPPPFTLGHEIAGWVEEIGSGVTKFKSGRRGGQSILGQLRTLSHVPIRRRESLPFSKSDSCSRCLWTWEITTLPQLF